jgi:methylated-DNA-protein-cysteine methyltransferase-like protein
MVYWAINKCPNDVPAHRVINRNGLLTGKSHFNGINLIQQLLENEGIVVEENKVINLENNFWDPSKELL